MFLSKELIHSMLQNNKWICLKLKSLKSALIAITLFSLLLSLFCLYLEPTISRDGLLYLELIQVWHEQGSFQAVLKHWPQFWIPPLPLYLMKLLMDCGLSPEAAGLGLNLVLAGFLPLIIYGIAMEVCCDRRIALCAAFLMAVNPTRVALSIEPQRDAVYLFFCGLLIYFLLCGIRRGKWYFWSLGGVVFALSFLTRYETLEFLPLIVAAFLLLLWEDRAKWKKLLLNGAAVSVSALAAFLLLIFIMGVQNHLFKSYQKYYLARWHSLERVFQRKGAK